MARSQKARMASRPTLGGVPIGSICTASGANRSTQASRSARASASTYASIVLRICSGVTMGRTVASAPVEDLADELRLALARAWDDDVRVEDLRRLSGGATSETWSFDAVRASAPVARLVLRRTRGQAVDEGALLHAAAAAGVPVPG